MKENEPNKPVVRVTQGHPIETATAVQDSMQHKKDKLKKPLIFGLMVIVFSGCMYLIFKPDEGKKELENYGLNDAVPQATDAAMQEDKQKAYEQEILEKKDQEKRNALATLSDYFNQDSPTTPNDEEVPEENQEKGNSGKQGNAALKSYRNSQSALSSFYSSDNSETMALRKQLDEVKEQLAERNLPQSSTVDDQLLLMEKSYQMASKYLPVSANSDATVKPATTVATKGSQKEQFEAFSPTRKNTVSELYREPTDSTFLSDWSQVKNRSFYNAGDSEQVAQPKNSIKACVYDAQVVVGDTGVRLRLLEPAKTASHILPKGTIVTAASKFQGGRLQLKITTVEFEGNIIPVDISIYDLDGQQGLNVPYSPERNALTEIAGNMGNATGSNFSMSSSAGQQITSDLSKSAVQGISGYFGKKVRTQKVTLKAGYQVFLLSKK